MKATGIVRRIDDLGRVVIPKEIRRTMRIREGDPLEIYTTGEGEVIFRKYSPVGEILAFSTQYADVLYKAASMPVIVCDKDHVIAVSGIPKKEIIERRISPALEESMLQRINIACTDANCNKIKPVEGIQRFALCSSPIIAAGDICGCILFLSSDETSLATDCQIKLIQVASAFLAKQLED
ncbi:MAG: stage V sporulation T C-terminal domain-containing protein [Oscillospiraceae bacterium]